MGRKGKRGRRGEKEDETDSGSRYRTDCRRIFFCAASASLKLNIDFASRAFQAGLRSNRNSAREHFVARNGYDRREDAPFSLLRFSLIFLRRTKNDSENDGTTSGRLRRIDERLKKQEFGQPICNRVAN